MTSEGVETHCTSISGWDWSCQAQAVESRAGVLERLWHSVIHCRGLSALGQASDREFQGLQSRAHLPIFYTEGLVYGRQESELSSSDEALLSPHSASLLPGKRAVSYSVLPTYQEASGCLPSGP